MVLSFAVRLLISLALCQTCANEELLGCPTGWLEYNKHCYFFGNPNTWRQAESDCASKEAHLTSILDEEERIWMKNSIKMTDVKIWIGLRRNTSGRQWEWTDGNYFFYSHWNTGEPNNVGGNENCVELLTSRANKKWNDLSCDDYRHYICKMPFRPVSPAIAEPATCPAPVPCPTTTTAKPATCPTRTPCPTTAKPATCPTPAPCPTTAKPATCPTPAPCPTTAKPATCPTPAPCPTTAKPATCPTPAPCPTTAKPATCPTPAPCPTTAKPATCPTPAPCPICPTTAKPATCPASPPPTNREFQMCTSSTNESCLLAMIAIPKGGFQDVQDGFSVARSIVIGGRSTPQAKRLVVNLDGRDANGKKATTALQLHLDLESQTFTLNYRVGGNWGGNRTGDLPRGRTFGAGLPFKIVIECGSGTFHLDFNDMLQLDLAGPEFDIGSINRMEVWQVMMSGVQPV
nr:uncharacterized protein LOC125983145 isoform X1 [Syngnathus scovelli]